MTSSTLRKFFDIRREEWPSAMALSFYFFLVIAVFWVLKPIKRGVLLNHFNQHPLDLFGWVLNAAQAEQIGKVLNMVVAYGVVIVFTLLVRKLARHHVVVTFCVTFSALFVVYAMLIDRVTTGLAFSFYVLGDIYNTAMVATFWAFTNDLNRAASAKRLYGIIGFGGVVGGFVGATMVSGLVETLGRPPLLVACIVPMVIIAVLAVWVHRRACAEARAAGEPACPEDVEEDGESERGTQRAPKTTANAAIEGARLVAASKYLLGIAALLAFYEIVSNVVDFQLASIVAQEITGDLEKDAFFGLLGQITGVASIIVQLVVTSFILQQFGVGVALIFLPVAILLGSVGFLAIPTLALVTFMSASDNSLNYSINQSAREALYTPTTPDEKYKAKAFIDMFVQRAAKVLAVILNLGLTAAVIADVRWLSIAVIVIILAWIVVVRFLNQRFEDRAAPPGREPAEISGGRAATAEA